MSSNQYEETNDGPDQLDAKLSAFLESLRYSEKQISYPEVTSTIVIDGILSIDNILQGLSESAEHFFTERPLLVDIKKAMEFVRSFLKEIVQKLPIDNIAQCDIIYGCINFAHAAEAKLMMSASYPSHQKLLISGIVEQTAYLNSEINKRFIVEGFWSEQALSKIDLSQEFDSHNCEIATATGAYLPLHNVIVGFEAESKKVKDMLMTILPGNEGDVISIVGMAGLGKTTLALKVYNDENITRIFDVRLWVTVSRDYNQRQLLLQLLGGPLDHYNEEDNGDLSNCIRQRLLGQRFLIVLDDIWSIDAWKSIISSLPMKNNGSRVLLTSRDTVVAEQAKMYTEPYYLSFRSDNESWALLKACVFQNNNCPGELLDVGRQIATKCQGLPLTVVLVAGLLLNVSENVDLWEQIFDNLKMKEIPDCIGAIEQSYKHLDDHLKLCLLYVASFPEDHEIPIVNLLRMWIAERFIAFPQGQIPRIANMDEAMASLSNLMSRFLLIPYKFGYAKRLKTVRVHDLVYEFCLAEAKKNSFLWCIHRDHPSLDQRRVCTNEIAFKNKNHRLARTIITNVCKEDCCGPYRDDFFVTLFESKIDFKLIKVLHLTGSIWFGETNVNALFGVLYHLRYVAINMMADYFEGVALHEGLSTRNLHKLETLVLRGSFVKLTNEIWENVNLRYLHAGEKLQISDEPFHNWCRLLDLEFLAFPILSWDSTRSLNLPNLRELKCFFSKSSRSNRFPNLEALHKLERLKIIGTPHDASLPSQLNLPSNNLKKLTLSRFRLPWRELSHMGMFPKLQILKLLIGSFVGEIWETAEGNYPNLKYLKLEKLDLKRWNASSEHFRVLERLVLEECLNLEEIPTDFANIITLQRIEVHGCCCSVGDSALEIQKELIEEYGIEDCDVNISFRRDNVTKQVIYRGSL